jgi:hypothetical protein
MKISFTKDEVIKIMRNHVSDLIDVEVTDLEQSNYGEDFIVVCCTKVEKTKNPRRWIKDESYRDPTPAPELD